MANRYTSADQALNGIDCGELGPKGNQIQGEFRAAFKPVLTNLFQDQVPAGVREVIVAQLIDTSIPAVLRLMKEHLNVRAA